MTLLSLSYYQIIKWHKLKWQWHQAQLLFVAYYALSFTRRRVKVELKFERTMWWLLSFILGCWRTALPHFKWNYMKKFLVNLVPQILIQFSKNLIHITKECIGPLISLIVFLAHLRWGIKASLRETTRER